MSDITERLQHAADYFPRIEDNPYSVFVDAKSEIEQLRARLTKHEQAVSVPEETLTAIHDTLRLVWSRELSADDGLDEIEILISSASADAEFDIQKECWRHEAEDLKALHQNLDDAGVPRYETGAELSAWGRALRMNQDCASADVQDAYAEWQAGGDR